MDVDVLDDFLASVDWSGTDQKRPKIADDLGQLEGVNWQYSRGELTKSQYVAHLLNILPEKERRKYLFLDGGAVTIRIVHRAEDLARPQLDRLDDRPETGSRVEPRLAEGVSRNDTVQVA